MFIATCKEWDELLERIKNADEMVFENSKDEEEYWDNLSKELKLD